MAYADGKITAPVDIWDPYSALGVSPASTGGGYNIGKLIAEHHGAVNKWAKFKPVHHYNEPFASSPGHPHYDAEWWKASYNVTGNNGDCGLRPAGWGMAGRLGFIKWIKQGAAAREWEYRYPTGGMAAPYCLADFAGYWHDAPSPFGELEDMEVIYRVGTGFSFTIVMPYVVKPSNGLALDLSDIRVNANNDTANPVNLGKWYFGVALYNPEGADSDSLFLTAQNPGERTIKVVDLPEGALANLLYGPGGNQTRVLPFMCNKKLVYGASASGDERFVAIPQKEPAVFTFESYDDLVYARCVALRETDQRTVKYKVYLVNNTRSSVTFKLNAANDDRITIYALRNYGDSYGTPIAYFDPLTVPAMSEKVIPSESGGTVQLSADYKAVELRTSAVSSNGTTIQGTAGGKAFIMTPATDDPWAKPWG